MNFCPDCGNTLTPDSNYCTKCGKLLMKLEKYESHISFSERDIFFCEICGTEIKQRYCPQCGNAIEKTEVKSALLPNPLRSGSLLSNIELNTDTLLPKKALEEKVAQGKQALLNLSLHNVFQKERAVDALTLTGILLTITMFFTIVLTFILQDSITQFFADIQQLALQYDMTTRPNMNFSAFWRISLFIFSVLWGTSYHVAYQFNIYSYDESQLISADFMLMPVCLIFIFFFALFACYLFKRVPKRTINLHQLILAALFNTAIVFILSLMNGVSAVVLASSNMTINLTIMLPFLSNLFHLFWCNLFIFLSAGILLEWKRIQTYAHSNLFLSAAFSGLKIVRWQVIVLCLTYFMITVLFMVQNGADGPAMLLSFVLGLCFIIPALSMYVFYGKCVFLEFPTDLLGVDTVNKIVGYATHIDFSNDYTSTVLTHHIWPIFLMLLSMLGILHYTFDFWRKNHAQIMIKQAMYLAVIIAAVGSLFSMFFASIGDAYYMIGTDSGNEFMSRISLHVFPAAPLMVFIKAFLIIWLLALLVYVLVKPGKILSFLEKNKSFDQYKTMLAAGTVAIFLFIALYTTPDLLYTDIFDYISDDLAVCFNAVFEHIEILLQDVLVLA